MTAAILRCGAGAFSLYDDVAICTIGITACCLLRSITKIRQPATVYNATMKCKHLLIPILCVLSIQLGCKQFSSEAASSKKTAEPLDNGNAPTLKAYLDSAKKWYPVEIVRLKLDPDTVQDYFIIDHSGISTGTFFNGKDSSEIETDGVHMPWSRPGIELEYRIIDVNCDDQQQEILVSGGGGGTAGLYLTSSIYRFDKESRQMKMIFEETISDSHHDEQGNDVTDEINYIDILNRNDSCINSIHVSRGRYKMGEGTYKIGGGIRAVKNSTVKKYRFDPALNSFVAASLQQP